MRDFEQEYNEIVLHIYEMMNQQQRSSSTSYSRLPKIFSKEINPTFEIWTSFIKPLLEVSIKQVKQKL